MAVPGFLDATIVFDRVCDKNVVNIVECLVTWLAWETRAMVTARCLAVAAACRLEQSKALTSAGCWVVAAATLEQG